jgi:hypothetical protein
MWGNRLVQRDPSRAHAVLVARKGGYRVSVRAPADRLSGAAAFCETFGGGGREAAAGIDHLPESELDRFAAALENAFRRA